MSEASSSVADVDWEGQIELLNSAQILRKLANQLTSWHEKDDENAIVRMTIPN